jgi:cytochrome c oxidase subunit I
MAVQTLPVGAAIDVTPPRRSSSLLLEWLHGWVVTVDHKRLGLMYMVYAIAFLLVGGAEAIAIRIQLAFPGNHFLSPEVYNEMFTMHGTTMVFLVGMMYIFGFGNYLVPLMVGARDMAFPRLNAFSFWMSAFGGLLLYYSFIGGFGLYGMGGAPDVTWWAYAPLTARAFSPGHATDYWALALIVMGFGTLGSAINIIATVFSMRCRGMTLLHLPLFVWLMLVTSGLTLIVITPLTAAQIMLVIDRYLGGHFFDTQAGGSATIWMSMCWCFQLSGSPARSSPSSRARRSSAIPRWSRPRSASPS